MTKKVVRKTKEQQQIDKSKRILPEIWMMIVMIVIHQLLPFHQPQDDWSEVFQMAPHLGHETIKAQLQYFMVYVNTLSSSKQL